MLPAAVLLKGVVAQSLLDAQGDRIIYMAARLTDEQEATCNAPILSTYKLRRMKY